MSVTSGTVVNGGDIENTTGTVSNAGTINLTGSYTNADTTDGNGTYTIAGDWINTGSFTPGTSTVNYNGSGAQSVAGMSYYHLTLSNAGTKTAGSNLTVNGTLTLNNDLSMGSNTLTMGPSSSTSGNGDVIGNVARTTFVTGTAYTFGNQFTAITFASGTLPTNVTVNITKGSTPAGKSDAIQRSYTITQTGGSGFLATLRLHYLDSELNGNAAADLSLWKNPGTWTDMGKAGTVNTTSKYAELSGVTSFSPWTLANASLHHFDVSLATPQLVGVAFTGTNTITARDQNNNAITSFDASANNVTLTASPNDGTIVGLGSGNANVLNQAGDFTNGVANVTGKLNFIGQSGNHTFTATSANGKTGTSATVALNRVTTNWRSNAVSSNWIDPANWTNGVPDSTKSVVISDSAPAPRVPLPLTNGRCFDLTVNNGGLLLWETSGGILYIHGNIVTTNGGGIDLGTYTPANQIIFLNNATFNNGGTVNAGNSIIDLKGSTWQNNNGSTFDPGTSTVIVDGSGNQTFNGDITFYNLTVTNTSGSVSFSGDVVVNNDLTAAPGSDVQVTGGGSISVEGDLNGTITSSPRPFMTSVVAASASQVDITFNTSVDSATSQTLTNYSINGGTVSVTNAAQDTSNHAIVHLSVATLTTGIEDTLTVNNVQDTLANVIAANSKKRFTLQPARAFYSRTSGTWNAATTWSNVSHSGASASAIPAIGDTVIIGDSNTITLNVNVANLNSITVNSAGTLKLDTFVVSGTGTFMLNSGGTLEVGSLDGITASGAAGNIQVSGSRSFGIGANYVYNGSSNQVTGNGLPATVNNLTISNTGGTVSLSNNVAIAGDLSVITGVFDIGTALSNHSLPVGGTLTVASGATLKVGGSSGGLSGSNFPSNFSSYVLNGTVEFTGAGTQTIPNLSFTNLATSGGSKSFEASMSIPGDLIVSSGTFDLGSNTANRSSLGGTLSVASGATLIIGGSSGGVGNSNFPSNFATVTLNGTVEFNGTSAQTIPAFIYTNLLLSNGGSKTIEGSFTVLGDLTVSAGSSLNVSPVVTLQIDGIFNVIGSLTNDGTINIGN